MSTQTYDLLDGRVVITVTSEEEALGYSIWHRLFRGYCGSQDGPCACTGHCEKLMEMSLREDVARWEKRDED